MNPFEKKITEIDLPFAKEYMKIDYDDDDALITTFIAAAKSYIQTILGFKFSDEWETKEYIPTELTIAALLLISHWYDQRRMQTPGIIGEEIKFAVSAIVEAHKNPFKEYNYDEFEYLKILGVV